MIAWSRKITLIAGVALILLTNAVALGGAVYNRMDEPESILRLSERELQPAYDWGRNQENSGMSLTLRWRILGEGAGDAIAYSYSGYGSAPKWLDPSKLAALGFDTAPRSTTTDRVNDGVLAKEVLLVLELNGASYLTALDGARKRAADAEASVAADANSKDVEQKAKNTRELLAREENEHSRLFVIDAGLDVGALRSQYPDRARYSIVRGQVRPYWYQNVNGTTRLVGHVNGLSVDHINVPYSFRSSPVLAAEARRSRPYAQLPPGEITVAFGRRLEPWITAVVKR